MIGSLDFYWSDTETYPAQLPIIAREAYHRDAWDREQEALTELFSHTRLIDVIAMQQEKN